MKKSIHAEMRSPRAKAAQLRRGGITPCSLIGASLAESRSIQMETMEAKKLLREQKVGSRLDLQLEGKTYAVMLKEAAVNNLKDEIEHLDFQVLQEDRKVKGVAHIVLTNRDKNAGFIRQSVDVIPYCAYPKDIVDTVEVDLSKVAVGSSLAVKDLEIAQKDDIELLIQADTTDRKSVV